MQMFTILPFFHLFNFATLETYHAARFEKGTRYYCVRLTKDLLDDWIITITNGRINSRLGQSRTLAFQQFTDTFEQFCLLAKLRHQRGYQCTSYQSDAYLFLNLTALLAVRDFMTVNLLSQQTLSINKKSTPIESKSSKPTGGQQLGLVFN